MKGYVKKPRQKFFLSLTIGGETERFCKKWIVDSRDELGIRHRRVFDDLEDAQKEFEYLEKDYDVKK